MGKRAAWFRVYERMIDSPQVLELDDAEFRLLVSLWCLASAENAGGVLPYSAAALRRRTMPTQGVEDVERMLGHLIALGLLEARGEGQETGYALPRWAEHQYGHPSWMPEARRDQKRVERARARVGTGDVVGPAVERPEAGVVGGVATMSQARRKRVASMSPSRARPDSRFQNPDPDPDPDTLRVHDASPMALAQGDVLPPGEEGERTPLRGAAAADAAPRALSVVRTSRKRSEAGVAPAGNGHLPREPDLLWEGCVTSMGGVGPLTRAERGKWNAGVKQLREAGVEAAEIGPFVAWYRGRYRDIAINPMALASNLREWRVSGHVGDDERERRAAERATAEEQARAARLRAKAGLVDEVFGLAPG